MFLRWISLNGQNSFVGLDISSNSIKLLKINANAVPYRIQNFGMTSLPPETIVKGEIKDTFVVSNTLKNLVNQAGITTKDIAIAVPKSSTIIKNINIDSRLGAEEIESRVWIEAKQQFPELVGDIYLDFVILGPSAQDTSLLEVMLVACRKDYLKPYIEILNMAGLNARIVDVSNFALERALSQIVDSTSKQKTIALLNLDLTISTLVVVQENKLIYSHEETFDGNRLMKQVREFPKDGPNYFEMLKENLSAHLRHSMHFFYSSRPNINIEKILLSGDCAVLTNLATFIQQEIGIETISADPFINMHIEPAVDETELKNQAPTLMLCAGLALSCIEQ